MILAFTNQKGGVGKTTTALNLGVYLANNGRKVLLVDIDPQSNLTSGIGYIPPEPKEDLSENENIEVKKASQTIYDVLIGKSTVHEVFVSTNIENLFLLPASIELAGAEIELVSMMSRELILKKALKALKDYYDYILIDCPPSLGLLTINGLVAAQNVIIPVQCEYYALEGLGQLVKTIQKVRNGLNRNLEIGGVVLTMYDKRTRLSKQVKDEVAKFFGNKVFKTIIPRNVQLSEAPSFGQPISIYEPKSPGAIAYEKLAKEIIKRFG